MKQRKQKKNTALLNVQKFFPKVKKVNDATEPISVVVTPKDSANSRQKRHAECAMAVAATRDQKADGVIISVKRAYVVKGDTATRYTLPESASREIVSFDRKAGFAPGNYQLSPIPKSERLGQHRGDTSHTGDKPKLHKYILQHKTADIRMNLSKV